MAAASACVAGSDVSGGYVWVSAERLRALESLEAELPALLEKAKAEAHAGRFAALRERDKLNPELHSKRSIEWYARNKDEINAKRREKYHAKKAATTAASTS